MDMAAIRAKPRLRIELAVSDRVPGDQSPTAHRDRPIPAASVG